MASLESDSDFSEDIAPVWQQLLPFALLSHAGSSTNTFQQWIAVNYLQLSEDWR